MSAMDEGRKKTLCICAAILAQPRLAELKDGEKDVLQAETTVDAILKAERILRQIDARWPANAIPGKT